MIQDEIKGVVMFTMLYSLFLFGFLELYLDSSSITSDLDGAPMGFKIFLLLICLFGPHIYMLYTLAAKKDGFEEFGESPIFRVMALSYEISLSLFGGFILFLWLSDPEGNQYEPLFLAGGAAFALLEYLKTKCKPA